MKNDILIYINFQSYTVVVKNGTSFPMSIQNMATHALYKIWKPVPYTKHGKSFQNDTSWLVYIGGSLNPLAHPQSS